MQPPQVKPLERKRLMYSHGARNHDRLWAALLHLQTLPIEKKDNPTKMKPDASTVTRCEFSQLMLMFFTMFGAGATARAGIDSAKAVSRRRRPKKGMAAPSEVEGVKLAIDFPTDDGWHIIHPAHSEEWREIEIDTDDVCPRLHAQLIDAQAAAGEPVLCRVLGDPAAILRDARFYAPGEQEEGGSEDDDLNSWRIHFEGSCMKRVEPDNNSWWQDRLRHNPRERAFMEHWLAENDESKKYAINSGCGLAQDLMLSTYQHEKPAGFEPWLTNRERRILATFVQWLGTNCGQGFLHEVASKGGIPDMLS